MPPLKGQLTIEILEDGQIKIETGNLEGPLHLSADQLLKEIQTLLGGEVVIEKIKKKANHMHTHENITHKH